MKVTNKIASFRRIQSQARQTMHLSDEDAAYQAALIRHNLDRQGIRLAAQESRRDIGRGHAERIWREQKQAVLDVAFIKAAKVPVPITVNVGAVVESAIQSKRKMVHYLQQHRDFALAQSVDNRLIAMGHDGAAK